MASHRKSRGYTLLELTTVLGLLALAVSAVLPVFSRTLDGFAVRGARERVAGALALARARAPGLGGAWVVVREDPAEVRVETSDSVLLQVSSRELGGVDIRITGRRDEAVFRYDALGVGRIASGTLRFLRGEAEVALVVSAYGRIDRR